MLKISHPTIMDRRDGIVVKVEGQAIGQWVDELRRVCDAALAADDGHGSGLVLDLNGLSFFDAAGFTLFRELAARNVSFTNCSVFIAEQLKEVTDDGR